MAEIPKLFEPVSKTGTDTVFVKFVPTLITEKEIESSLGEEAEITRLNIPGTKKKSNTVKIKVKSIDKASELVREGIVIKSARYVCKPKRNFKFFRCYNCQRHGHTANNCWRNKICSNCAEESCELKNCSKTPYCVNCKKGGHNSRDSKCPVYIDLRNKLINRRIYNDQNTSMELQIPKHIC